MNNLPVQIKIKDVSKLKILQPYYVVFKTLQLNGITNECEHACTRHLPYSIYVEVH